MKDAVATMGGILPDDAGGRDAVHVAVLSVVAGENLAPGQDIGFIGGVSAGEHVVRAGCTKPIGIVDPFLKSAVLPQQRFWMFLYPRTITGLNHNWTHPDVPSVAATPPAAGVHSSPSSKLASEQWLKNFCETSDCPGYEAVLAKATLVADGDNDAWDDEYMIFYGSDAHGDIPSEFWDHVEVVLGKKISGTKPRYFSCSC